MGAVLVDSGPLVALFDGSDADHRRCVDWLASWDGILLTTPSVITEVAHILGRRCGQGCQIDFVQWAAQSLRCDDGTSQDLPRIAAIMAKYRDLPADFADASLVAMAERRALYDVISVDADFTVYCAAARRRFRNLLDG
ncbi:MAG: PIN domain-containing protein [Gemmatimonadota bacterium]